MIDYVIVKRIIKTANGFYPEVFAAEFNGTSYRRILDVKDYVLTGGSLSEKEEPILQEDDLIRINGSGINVKIERINLNG